MDLRLDVETIFDAIQQRKLIDDWRGGVGKPFGPSAREFRNKYLTKTRQVRRKGVAKRQKYDWAMADLSVKQRSLKLKLDEMLPHNLGKGSKKKIYAFLKVLGEQERKIFGKKWMKVALGLTGDTK